MALSAGRYSPDSSVPSSTREIIPRQVIAVGGKYRCKKLTETRGCKQIGLFWSGMRVAKPLDCSRAVFPCISIAEANVKDPQVDDIAASETVCLVGLLIHGIEI